MISSKSLWGLIALGTIALAATEGSAAVRLDVSLIVAGQTVGQANKSSAAGRREAETLMSRARQAIQQGDLETAESLITSVEKLNVSFSVFHFGDTPRKLRGDLKSAQRASKKKQPSRPSQKFTPELPSQAPTEPVAQAQAQSTRTPRSPREILDPRDEPPLNLPESEGRIKPLLAPLGPMPTPDDELGDDTRLPAPAGEPAAAQGEQGDLRRQSDLHLLSARRALAVGDVKRATESVEAARKLGVTYGFHDDTPDRVAAAIGNYQQVSEATAGRKDEASRRQLAGALMDQAQQLMRYQDYDEAERLVRHVQSLRIQYGPFDVKPETLAERIAAARGGAAPNEPSEAAERPGAQEIVEDPGPHAGQGDADGSPGEQAVFNPSRDATRNRQASAVQEEAPVETEEVVPAEPVGRLPDAGAEAEPIPPSVSDAMQMLALGEEALKAQDRQRAQEFFKQAYQLRDQLDPVAAQRLQDHMQLLATPPAGSKSGKGELLLDEAAAKQALLVKQVSNDLAKQELAADKLRENDPKRAMEMLKQARAAVEASGIDTESRGQLLRRVDRKIGDLDKYILAHRATIEQDDANKEILKDVDRRLEAKLEIDDALAEAVDQFNKLMDEERFAEAEVLAKRARELDPENPLVKQLIWQSKFVSRKQRNDAISDGKESGFYTTMTNVDESAIPFDDNEPIRFGDAKTWEELTKTRSQRLSENRTRKTERDLEIEKRLKTPVSLKFRDRPLAEVLEHLAKLAAVNLFLDPKGLEEEGIASDTPVTIDLTQDISLKSALNLILDPLNLSYVIQNEVLKITSEQLRDGVVITRTYDVADLVIPIPNFLPNGRTGMAGAIAEAYNMTGTGQGLGPGSAFVASPNGTPASGIIDPQLMAQINQLMPGGGGQMASGTSQPINYGPGGMGEGAQPDFDSLIELITTTVKPQTWDEVGGPGSVTEFQNNLSLVISQTEDVHEEIVDLLDQLRRNQDLQVTIEVRFITLSDSFFERIGVDFDFNIVNSSATLDPRSPFPKNKKEIVGLNPSGSGAAAFPNYTGNLEIPFRQESFDLAVPQFGTPVSVANFGFAILSDLEAFLLVQAAQGDRRSNVLQAPKVTLFNGQLASVFDSTLMPFVISVIPVVGDFAAAYQPVITVLSEGTALTVQAVISHDRRFVRLTVLPLFSQIGDVTEFKFSGSTTTTTKSSESESTGGESGDSSSAEDDDTVTSEGVTVQLPNVSVVTVTTTVSVPDGGTVLLGGVKRLSEGRNEFGVPILSKLPYINRLFKNVGIGRETTSLMMMVTPRIIIQEEEEERLGLQLPP